MNEFILQEQLEAAAQKTTPLHMPGHKRRVAPAPGLSCYAWDTTETPATDDLHAADGILAAAMRRTARLCGAQRTWYLVNGSTGGLLAAVRAAAPRGGTVIAARNCHKAVYHAIELCGLAVRWVTPPTVPGFGIYASVPLPAVAAALDETPDAACVVLTTPTYEGVLSDAAALAALCHARGVPLVADEAHGAHYLPAAVRYGWRGGAVAAGADLVVQSAHKTLPSLTQTALLHLNGDLIDPAEVERQLDVFETSSPSYPLLASLDGCTGLLAAHGAAWFAAWRENLTRLGETLRPLRHLRVLGCGAPLPEGVQAHDAGKILVNGAAAGCTGADLAAALRARGLEPEMACGMNLLAMTSPCDAPETFDRLADALLAVDAAPRAPLPDDAPVLPPPGEAVLPVGEAVRRRAADVPEREAEGRVSAEYVWAYPPGVPLLAPGERVTAEFLAAAAALRAAGTRLRHTAAAPDCLRVLAK